MTSEVVDKDFPAGCVFTNPYQNYVSCKRYLLISS
jgi:hypothetical protein